ncbi:MAG: DMT family transporter [Terriglobales bacterium]
MLLIFIAFIWGSTFVLVKEALNDASPLALNSARMVVAAVLLALFYRKKIAVLTKPALMAGVLVGIFLYAGYAFQTSGLKLTTPSKSAFLTGTSSVLVPLFLVAIWHVRIHLWRVAGILLALVGLFLMTVPGGPGGLADFANVNLGDLLTVGCAICFTFHVIFVGRASQRFPFEQVAFLQVATAAVLMTISTPLLEHSYFRATPTVIAAILITGVLCTAVAFSIQSWAQQFTPATHTALIFTTEPVFAWLTSFIYLHERLGLRARAGALLILGGVLISELLGQVEKPDDELVRAESSASSGG